MKLLKLLRNYRLASACSQWTRFFFSETFHVLRSHQSFIAIGISGSGMHTGQTNKQNEKNTKTHLFL